jgi:hypothetical protein
MLVGISVTLEKSNAIFLHYVIRMIDYNSLYYIPDVLKFYSIVITHILVFISAVKLEAVYSSKTLIPTCEATLYHKTIAGIFNVVKTSHLIIFKQIRGRRI